MGSLEKASARKITRRNSGSMGIRSWLRMQYVCIFARPVKEMTEQKAITRDFFPTFITPDDVIVEVGARIGNATSTLARYGKFVHAVEADPTNYRLLRSYMRQKHNVRTYHFAAWSSNEKGELKIANNDCFSGISSVRGLSHENYVRTVAVDFRRLDSVGFEPGPSALIMDCEGAEAEVLKGAIGLLSHISKIVVETHITEDGYDSTSDVSAILETGDFELREWLELGKERKSWIIGTRKE